MYDVNARLVAAKRLRFELDGGATGYLKAWDATSASTRK